MYIQMVHPPALLPEQLDACLEQGWYRMVQSVFTCRFVLMGGDLHSAIWIRLPLDGFTFRKSLRKLMSRNRRRFSVRCDPAQLTEEKESLYQRYRAVFHGDLSPSLHEALYGDDERDIFDTREFTIWDEDKLVGFSFFDVGLESMQSVMGIYDPDYARHSLGFFTMLMEVDWGIAHGLRYFYPGYIAPGYPAFDYKLRVGGALEFYNHSSQSWHPLDAMKADMLPAARLKRGLEVITEALEEAGVEASLRLYPPYRVASLDPRLSQCLQQPLFVECHPKRGGAFCLLVTYDYEDNGYTLELCLRYADLTEQLGSPTASEDGPRLCMHLLQRVMELGEARSARAIASAVTRLGSVV